MDRNKLYICGVGIHCISCGHAKVHFPFHKHLILKNDKLHRKYILVLCNKEGNHAKGTVCARKCEEFKTDE